MNEPTPPPSLPAPSPTPRPRRLLTALLVGGAALAVLAGLGARPRPQGAPPLPELPDPPPVAAPPATVTAPQGHRPRVELVFALDTTGSMTSLLEGAKRKIWSLASFVARGQPTPELRVGLVAYRDVGDEYVTRVHDLDEDMDRVYARLRQLRADGGGDTPEHVARALHEAVHRMSWTDRQDVVKVIYLVGDAPPHTDYHDGYDLLAAARTAAGRGIRVHTIRCGDDPDTERSWRQIASLARGEFLTIEQGGGMHDESTPYDAELGRLHDALTGTALGYGAAARAVAATASLAAAAPAEAKAERAAFMAAKGKAIAAPAGDLVTDVESGRVALESVHEAELPDGLRGLDPAARKARLHEVKRSRDELLTKISALSGKREAYLRRKDATGGTGDGFDAAAKRTLRKTAADNPLAGLELR